MGQAGERGLAGGKPTWAPQAEQPSTAFWHRFTTWGVIGAARPAWTPTVRPSGSVSRWDPVSSGGLVVLPPMAGPGRRAPARLPRGGDTVVDTLAQEPQRLAADADGPSVWSQHQL
ncbi:hypothetical protein KNE206_78660 [Kitasatospora sp. NE20-6]